MVDRSGNIHKTTRKDCSIEAIVSIIIRTCDFEYSCYIAPSMDAALVWFDFLSILFWNWNFSVFIQICNCKEEQNITGYHWTSREKLYNQLKIPSINLQAKSPIWQRVHDTHTAGLVLRMLWCRYNHLLQPIPIFNGLFFISSHYLQMHMPCMSFALCKCGFCQSKRTFNSKFSILPVFHHHVVCVFHKLLYYIVRWQKNKTLSIETTPGT